MPSAEADEFATFVARHRPGLFRHVRRRVLVDEDAEDITQEALLRTWRRRARHEDDLHRRNFMYHVANQLVIDLYRRQAHIEADAEVTEDVAGTAPDAESLVLQAEQSQELVDGLSALPEPQRALIVDADVLELTPAEMRERHGASLEVLRARRYRAREALRRHFHRVGAPGVIAAPTSRRLRMPGWLHDVMAWTSPYVQPLTVVVTTISVVVGPFGIPTPQSALAISSHGRGTTSAEVADWQRHGAPGRQAPMSDVGDPPRPGDPAQQSAPEPDGARAKPPAVPVGHVPDTCVPGACVGAGDGGKPADVQPGDKLWVKPLGEEGPHATEEVVPVCEDVPDNPGVGCERQGKPDWRVDPPPPSPSSLP
jgi:RNA polymerase sigma-70 factor (ECF subfamily)